MKMLALASALVVTAACGSTQPPVAAPAHSATQAPAAAPSSAASAVPVAPDPAPPDPGPPPPVASAPPPVPKPAASVARATPASTARSSDDIAGLLGGPRVPGAASASPVAPNAADRVIATLRGRFKTCYQRALARDPSMSGSLKVSTTPSRDGCGFATVTVERQGTYDEELASCLKTALSKIDLCTDGAGGLAVPINIGL